MVEIIRRKLKVGSKIMTMIIEQITQKDLTPYERKLRREALANIERGDYSKFTTLKELKKEFGRK